LPILFPFSRPVNTGRQSLTPPLRARYIPGTRERRMIQPMNSDSCSYHSTDQREVTEAQGIAPPAPVEVPAKFAPVGPLAIAERECLSQNRQSQQFTRQRPAHANAQAVVVSGPLSLASSALEKSFRKCLLTRFTCTLAR
jgi:hypothetical protein